MPPNFPADFAPLLAAASSVIDAHVRRHPPTADYQKTLFYPGTDISLYIVVGMRHQAQGIQWDIAMYSWLLPFDAPSENVGLLWNYSSRLPSEACLPLVEPHAWFMRAAERYTTAQLVAALEDVARQ